jgi:LmbE family N-acetylglucosaminyl deacetylase
VISLQPRGPHGRPFELLVVGAHADDIEIGCGGTVLHLAAGGFPLKVTWVVLGASGVREREALGSAAAFLKDVAQTTVVLKTFRDGFFPWAGAEVKEVFEQLKREAAPDLIIVPRRDDAHQDHRLVAELTWNTFRDHLVLEYEIPKYEGDLAQPNAYIPVSAAVARRKVGHLRRHFSSQGKKDWFGADTFLGLMRLRGMESRSPSGFAEAFHARKLVL